MEIKVRIRIEDWRTYLSYINEYSRKNSGARFFSFWTMFFIFVPIGLAYALGAKYFHYQIHVPTAICISVFFILIIGVYFYIFAEMQKACDPSEKGMFLGGKKFLFDEDGVKSEGNSFKTEYLWSGVTGIERANGLILIFIDSTAANIIPEADLENPDEVYKHIKKLYANANGYVIT